MIYKDAQFKNKFQLTESSTTAELRDICRTYKNLRCLICNAKTAERFDRNPISFTPLPITINNKVADDVIYINGIF